MRVVRQTLMLLFLGLALAVPTASAADLETPQAQQAGQSSPDFLKQLWQLFTGLWNDAGGFLAPLGGEEQPPTSDTDAGGMFDPLGRLDAGGMMDPLG
jgi:hypothetical protein